MLSISRLSDGGELLRMEIRDRYPFHDDGRGASRLEGRGRFPIRCGAEARRVLCRAIIGGLQGSERGVALVQQVGEWKRFGSHGLAGGCCGGGTLRGVVGLGNDREIGRASCGERVGWSV